MNGPLGGNSAAEEIARTYTEFSLSVQKNVLKIKPEWFAERTYETETFLKILKATVTDVETSRQMRYRREKKPRM